ncbi:MAG TPA: glycosyltransferase [Blastocatellia bacterium]|nr:glycosyltransferase [Blastocatellia bacterium]
MTLSVIIPTKNRQADLVETVQALLAQTRLPDELIVVDQSVSNEGGTALGQLLEGAGIARSTYIWDWMINGLPMARNAGFSASSGQMICFLDDDTTPAPDYLENIERGFADYPAWDGLCGKLTDTTRISPLRKLARAIFRRGIFKDDRAALATLTTPTAVNLLPGAAFCFRRRVLERFSFDDGLVGYGLGEDIEFCQRAGQIFQFGAYPAARAHHRRSSVGRAGQTELRSMVVESSRRMWLVNRRHLGDDLCYLWLCVGLVAERLSSLPGKWAEDLAKTIKTLKRPRAMKTIP